MKDVLWEVVLPAIGVVLILAAIAGIGIGMDAASCRNYGDVTGRNTDYRIIGGCFVETDRGWFLKDQVWDQEGQR